MTIDDRTKVGIPRGNRLVWKVWRLTRERDVSKFGEVLLKPATSMTAGALRRNRDQIFPLFCVLL